MISRVVVVGGGCLEVKLVISSKLKLELINSVIYNVAHVFLFICPKTVWTHEVNVFDIQ